MSTIKQFHLPDLGEGLPDATVVEWLVKEGETARLDEPLVSMETAKAVVEVPAPCSGKLLRTGGPAGSVIPTGALLAEFELDPSLPQRAEAHDTGHHHGPPPTAHAAPAATPTPAASPAAAADAGTVVGAMQASDQLRGEQTLAVGGVRAMPAVRAQAKKLGIDLARVRPSGADSVVTMQDVKRAAAGDVDALLPSPTGRGAGGEGTGAQHAASVPRGHSAGAGTVDTASQRPAAPHVPSPQPLSRGERGSSSDGRTALSASGRPLRTQPPGVMASGQPEPLTGVRRNMARVMAAAHAQVVATTLADDADIEAWRPGEDITVRLIRALVRAARVEPALNAWFDGEALTRTLHPQVDVGIAMDTPDGLFVPALRNADMLDPAGVRHGIERLRKQVFERSIAPSELSGYTISLSNFGKFAGRYATPIVVPPCVAILAAGRGRHQMTPVMGGFAAHRVIPLSLTFDHRAATGGEAARFLRAVLDDLALPD
jgi:2-oxoisovalerate dehydrogenase E2 component (dihydrolipoyl transacylase)